MASGLYTNVSDTRLTAGNLVAPDTMLDLMGATWAGFTAVFDLNVLSASALADTEWYSVNSVSVCFPDRWGIDGQFDPQMVLRVCVRMYGVVSPGIPTPDSAMRLGTDGVAATWSGAKSGYRSLILDYPATATLPTGVVTYPVYMKTTASDTMACLRVYGDDGPSCYYQFVIP